MEQKTLFDKQEVKEAKTHAFLKPCGCVSAVIMDYPYMYGEISKAYKYAEKHGETHSLIDTQEVREMPWKCKEHQTG